jgi:hypothetical protein
MIAGWEETNGKEPSMTSSSHEGDSQFARRHVLQVGGLGSLGVTLPRLLESDARCDAGGIRPEADACVILFLNGGPSHLDMWDLKPGARERVG